MRSEAHPMVTLMAPASGEIVTGMTPASKLVGFRPHKCADVILVLVPVSHLDMFGACGNICASLRLKKRLI